MNYIQVSLKFDIRDVETDIVTSLLTLKGFDSFEEMPYGLLAYIPEDLWDKDSFLQTLPSLIEGKISLGNALPLEDRNWNEVWESNFPAVVIAGKCRVRAPFHDPDPAMGLELIIEPKMSFGTAHHETTSQIIELQLDMDWNGKKVLDMGCGTAILSIVAAKMGADSILAIDNDKWAYENSLENIERNNVETVIQVEMGDASILPDETFDIVIANINRNILLQDLPAYVSVMKPASVLMLSGFYTEDLIVIKEKALELGLTYSHHIVKNNWVAAVFTA